MFLGEYNHQIDEKCRFRIPAKFKDELGSNPFIMPSPSGCLTIMSQSMGEQMFEKRFGESDFTDVEANEVIRLIAPKAAVGAEDKQGRILLPVSLISHAAINKDIVIIGMYKVIELWSKERYEEKYGNVTVQALGQAIVNLKNGGAKE